MFRQKKKTRTLFFKDAELTVTSILPDRLLLPGKLISDLLPSLQDQVKQQGQQHADTDNGKVLAPVTRCLVPRITHDAQDGNI